MECEIETQKRARASALLTAGARERERERERARAPLWGEGWGEKRKVRAAKFGRLARCLCETAR